MSVAVELPQGYHLLAEFEEYLRQFLPFSNQEFQGIAQGHIHLLVFLEPIDQYNLMLLEKRGNMLHYNCLILELLQSKEKFFALLYHKIVVKLLDLLESFEFAVNIRDDVQKRDFELFQSPVQTFFVCQEDICVRLDQFFGEDDGKDYSFLRAFFSSPIQTQLADCLFEVYQIIDPIVIRNRVQVLTFVKLRCIEQPRLLKIRLLQITLLLP